MSQAMQVSVLRLFNAVQVGQRNTAPHSAAVLERAIRHGYLLDPAIPPDVALLDAIDGVVGLSGPKANAAFHKSWAVVHDSPLEQLAIQQIIHYLTTYGFERLGIYRQDAVYIPAEVLDVPGIQADIPLTIVRALDAQEILGRIVQLSSGIALAQETLDDLLAIVKANAYDRAFVNSIGNRELKALLSDLYELVPSEPVEFLRYLVAKLTGESLLIKNDYLIDKIKHADGKQLDALLAAAPDNLATIFLRFKPLFLALKSISGNKTFFNRLRKQAVKLHQPAPADYLNGVTAQIKRRQLNLELFEQRVQHAPIFRKIRLAYALSQRLHSGASIVYRVRNGRGWATEFAWQSELFGVTSQALSCVLAAIARDLRPNVAGQTIYIPPHMHYALPATEKQFTGNLPSGSYVSIPQDLIVGIHWVNTGKRVDLDLSVIGESGKIGWDAAYRSEGHEVLFSGDMTDAPAPDGASELFYFKQGPHEARILFVNYFNFQAGDVVAGKLLVAHEKPGQLERNYVVDPNHIVATANITIERRQNIVGLIVNLNGENRVYFANVSVGSSLTSRNGNQSTHARQYLVSSLVNSLAFRAILGMAGATVVDTRPSGAYVDLSPEQLDKTTIINLISPPAL